MNPRYRTQSRPDHTATASRMAPGQRPSAPGRTCRSGKTLIELAVVISIMAVVLSSGLRMLHVLFRAERTGTRKAAETAVLGQLTRQFRRDVHAAGSAQIVPSPDGANQLELTTGGTRVLYSPGNGAVLRSIVHDDEDGAGSQQRFRLPRRSVRVEQTDDGGWATLVCEPADPAGSAQRVPDPRMSSPVPLRVEAHVGRDRRFQGDAR